MTIAHGSAIRTTIADAVVDAVDNGSSAGVLKFYTAGFGTLLCTITFSDPAFGAASGGSATMLSGPKSGTCSAGGTVAKFRIEDSNGVSIIEGDVGTSGQDINLSSVTVNVNDVIQITSLTYTAPT